MESFRLGEIKLEGLIMRQEDQSGEWETAPERGAIAEVTIEFEITEGTIPTAVSRGRDEIIGTDMCQWLIAFVATEMCNISGNAHGGFLAYVVLIRLLALLPDDGWFRSGQSKLDDPDVDFPDFVDTQIRCRCR